MFLRNTNSSTNTTHPTMDVAYEQAYYTSRPSDTTGVNKFKIGATNETLTAVWRAVDQTVKITPNNANGNYKVTATNLFDKNDMLTANSKIISRTTTAWNGASYIGEDSTHTISGWIRVVPGATYKITGATEAGMVEWSKGTKAKTSYFYTVETQATSYSNNTAFTAPTSFTNTSGNTASVTYAYMRFHFKTSDLNNIALSMTDSSSYTNTQTLYFPNNASISVVATPNTGYTAGVSKSSGLGTLTTSTSGSVVTGNLANIAGNASTTNIAVTFTEKTATLTYNANGHGTAPANVTMKYTTATNAASAITATNYRFDGWNTKADGTGTAYAAGAQVKAANVIPSAITLYAQWTYNETPSISVTDYNTFSYSGTASKAYYVSTSNTAPSAGTAQTSFELNKWTTATSTGDLTLTAGQTYYVFIEDANATTGKVSINKANIAVRTVTRSVETGSGLTVKYTSSSGANVTFSSNKANMLNGTVIYVSATANTGYQSPVLKKDNASATNSITYTITANTTFTSSASEKTATLTYNANGHGTAPANVTMKYTTATNAASAITATNYRFDGWNTKADGTGTAYAAGAQVKAANVVPSAITLYAQWTYNATPSITLTDYNTFSFSGAGANAYYVSTSNTTPSAGTAQTSFTLNKWITATSTGDLTLTEGQTYYVFIEDANATTGKVSINKASIAVRTVTRSVGTGSDLTVKYTNSSGANVTFSSDKANMLNGTVIYVSATASTGYKNPVLKKDNASATNSTTYTITANTTFASSATANTYTVKFNKNATNATGTMSNQSFTYDVNQALTANAFTRIGYRFTGWSTLDSDTNIIFDSNEYSYDNTSGTNYATLKQYEIAAPFSSGDVYQLEVDAKGTGTLSNFFYGATGYLEVASWTNSNGQSGTTSDGHNVIPISNDYTHYSVRFTLGNTGNGSINKRILFRTQTGCNASIKNVRFYKVTQDSTVYTDEQIVKNIAASGTVNLYAIWQATYYEVSAPIKYTNTLAEAVSVANAGATITLLEDSITDSSTIDITKNITYNLNNKTITYVNEFAISNGTTTVNGPGLMNSGSIYSSFILKNAGNLNLNNAELRGLQARVSTSGNSYGSANIDNSVIRCRQSCISTEGRGDVTINNSSIVNETHPNQAIEGGGTGTITITGASIVGNCYNATGSTASGGAANWDSAIELSGECKLYVKGTSNVIVNDTEYNNGSAIYINGNNQVYIQESAGLYSFSQYCIKCGYNGNNASINVNTNEYLYAAGSYAIGNLYSNANATITLTKGKFVSRDTNYMVYNKNTESYPGGTTTNTRYFYCISGFDATTGKAILGTQGVPNCYFLQI